MAGSLVENIEKGHFNISYTVQLNTLCNLSVEPPYLKV